MNPIYTTRIASRSRDLDHDVYLTSDWIWLCSCEDFIHHRTHKGEHCYHIRKAKGRYDMLHNPVEDTDIMGLLLRKKEKLEAELKAVLEAINALHRGFITK